MITFSPDQQILSSQVRCYLATCIISPFYGKDKIQIQELRLKNAVMNRADWCVYSIQTFKYIIYCWFQCFVVQLIVLNLLILDYWQNLTWQILIHQTIFGVAKTTQFAEWHVPINKPSNNIMPQQFLVNIAHFIPGRNSWNNLNWFGRSWDERM